MTSEADAGPVHPWDPLDGRYANALLALATLAVGLLPAIVLLGLAYLSGRDQTRRELDAAVALALRNTEHVLDQAISGLEPVMPLVGEPCTAETVSRLARAVYDSSVVREVGLFRDDLQVYCTNFGGAQVYPEPAVRERFPSEGLFVTVFRTVIMGEPSVVVHRRLASGAGANAVVTPQEFRNEVLGEALGVPGGFRLTLADGTVIGQTAGMVLPGTPGYLSAEAVSARLPVRVEATRSAADLVDSFLDRVPLFGLVGVVLGAVTASAFGNAVRRRLSLESELRTAVRRRELEVHYQPIVDLATGCCAGAEALVRWRHPKRGLVHPGLFIAMAEETGLVMPMTSWMLEQVREDLCEHFAGRPDFHVGVNLVAQHFRDEAIVRDVRDLLERPCPATRGGAGPAGPLDPSALMFEATERQLIVEGDGTARRVMEAVRTLGCTVALDDFGTGQSSLAYLHRFPVDYLKIDKAFVDTIGTDSLSRPVLDAVIDLGHRLQLRLIAEGVEHPHQAEYLRARGVHYAQGFLFSPPLPLAALVAFVSARNGGLAREASAPPPVPDAPPALEETE